jgi:dihydropyrimidinase
MYPRKGVLQPGSDADLFVFDPDAMRTTRAADLESASGYTIYEGEELGGWPELVLLRGRTIVQDGAVITDAALGQHVPA